MKLLIFIATLLVSINLQAKIPTIKGLKTKFSQADMAQMKKGGVINSYSMMNWLVWERQPGVSLLEPSGNYRPPEDLFVFHSRTAFIVNKPAESFTANHFLSLKTLKKLEPGNRHKQYDCANLCVVTEIPFPEEWAEDIEDLKSLGFLSEENTTYLEVDSEYVFGGGVIQSKELKQLIPLAEQPVAVLSQRTKSINQMFQFAGSLITIHNLEGQSLVTIDVALGVEKDLDDKINSSVAKQIGLALVAQRDPRHLIGNILLGKDSHYNAAKSGIGTGLPKYTKSVGKRLKKLMEKM